MHGDEGAPGRGGAAATCRFGGDMELKRRLLRARKKLRTALKGGLYQQKLVVGMEERWQKIRDRLDSHDGSLLDLGCNAGVFTRRAADLGVVALGCDIDPKAIAMAVRAHAGVQRLSFMQFELTPSTIEYLPTVDVVLCLSVHHYWVRIHGEDQAWGMLGGLLRKTNRKLFFEPASRLSKYKPAQPAFITRDRASIERYNVERLRTVVPAGATITCLGDAPALKREGFRMMFLVNKNPTAGDQ
jgi:SAM-dependent methyltransferase